MHLSISILIEHRTRREERPRRPSLFPRLLMLQTLLGRRGQDPEIARLGEIYGGYVTVRIVAVAGLMMSFGLVWTCRGDQYSWEGRPHIARQA
jgi:hypothetical protein